MTLNTLLPSKLGFGAAPLGNNASHGGIFDDAGNLLAYGWLQITGGDDPDSVVFPPSEVQIE